MCGTFIKRRTTLYFFVTLGSFACVILLGISLGTTNWIQAYVSRDVTIFNTSQPLRGFLGTNPIDSNDPGAFRGVSFFGLFYGCKRFNYGLGGRGYDCYSVLAEHDGVYNTGVVIAVIVFMIPALVFALVSTVFGLVNILTVPIDTLHGPVGLYVWNIVGLLCSAVATILYIALFFTQLQREVLNPVDRDPPNNFHTDQVDFGFSFWLLIATFVIFCLNIVCVFLAQLVQDPHLLTKRSQSVDMTKPRNDVGLGIMY